MALFPRRRRKKSKKTNKSRVLKCFRPRSPKHPEVQLKQVSKAAGLERIKVTTMNDAVEKESKKKEKEVRTLCDTIYYVGSCR